MAEIKKYLDNLAAQELVKQIKAADAATLASAKAYCDGKDSQFDAAGAANTALENAKTYTNEEIAKVNAEVEKKADKTALEAEVTRATGKEEELAGSILAVDGKADANAEAIEAINNETTGILAQAKKFATEEDAKVQGNIDTLAGKVGEVPEGSTVMGIITNIQENAYDDTELRGLISGLDTNKADKTQVATDIAAAVKVEEDARKEAVKAVQDAVDALSGTHATDKKALEDAIALKADQTALDAVSAVANAAVKQADYDVKVKALEDEDARIVGLVEAEAAKAREEEGKLDARLVEVETFFKTTEGQTIDEALDTLVEIQKYITDEGSAADEMVKDIAANKKAIEDHIATDHDFAGADAALKAELEGKINAKADATVVEGIDGRVEVVEGKVSTLEGEMDTVEGKVSTLEGKMTTVEGAVATKAEAQALTDAVAALEQADAGLDGRIDALEAKFGEGEGSVEDMIADAKQEAIDAAAGDATTKANKALEDAKKYADEEDAKIESRVDALETASATHALASDLTTLAGRVTTAEGEIDTLQTEMDAVEALAAANKSAHEANAAAIALKASQADLEAAVARIGANETAIATKAAQADLEALTERVSTNETNIAANTSAIAAFQPITAGEIEAMFA